MAASSGHRMAGLSAIEGGTDVATAKELSLLSSSLRIAVIGNVDSGESVCACLHLFADRGVARALFFVRHSRISYIPGKSSLTAVLTRSILDDGCVL